MNELALFAGVGGGLLGSKLLGWRTVCAVERDAYAAAVLAQRQNDGLLDLFPIWSDIETFDGNPWRGIAEIISGGFPCQDITASGSHAGIFGKRSGLWKEMARIIGEVRPQYAFVENSSNLIKRGLSVVLADLAQMGYASQWGIIGAIHANAPHRRERTFICAVSDPDSIRCHEQAGFEKEIQQSCEQRVQSEEGEQPELYEFVHGGCFNEWVTWWRTEPGLERVVDGVANRMERLKAIGNGQVPAVVRKAWHILCQRAITRYKETEIFK